MVAATPGPGTHSTRHRLSVPPFVSQPPTQPVCYRSTLKTQTLVILSPLWAKEIESKQTHHCPPNLLFQEHPPRSGIPALTMPRVLSNTARAVFHLNWAGLCFAKKSIVASIIRMAEATMAWFEI